MCQGVSSLLEIPTDSCHFFCTPGNPCATPIVTHGEGSFSYQGVSTRGVRHSPEIRNSLWWDWQLSETGRLRFRRVWFQTPNSVSFLALTEFGENSVSSSQPIICVPTRTHRVFRRTRRVCPRTQWGSVSSLIQKSTLETVFRPFPKLRSWKSKRGLSKRGLGLKGANWAKKGLFGAISALPHGCEVRRNWSRSAPKRPRYTLKRPQSAPKRPDFPGRISHWISLKIGA